MRAEFLKELEEELLALADRSDSYWIDDRLRSLARRVAVELEQERLRRAA